MKSSLLNEWDIHYINWQKPSWRIRTGIMKSRADSSCSETILYLQGLSDSLANHSPFFTFLTELGYSIVAFDYPGQGDSSGCMNQLRILPHNKQNAIATIADAVWQRYCPEKSLIDIVIGWSTGGLATYELASRERAKKVICIAPGIGIKKLMDGKFFTTYSCLTHADYSQCANPHIDPIKPSTPLIVPMFAQHLLSVERQAKQWRISDSVNGMICLSSEKDPYVNPEITRRIVSENATHFQIKSYQNALHEVDNEISSIQEVFFSDVKSFLVT